MQIGICFDLRMLLGLDSSRKSSLKIVACINLQVKRVVLTTAHLFILCEQVLSPAFTTIFVFGWQFSLEPPCHLSSSEP